MKPRIIIVVLNTNAKADILECLNSLKNIEYQNYEILVVDNGSKDGSLELIKSSFPELTVIQNDRNLGCSAGRNVGARYALREGADYIFFIDTDAVVDREIVNVLMEAAQADDAIGMLGAVIYAYSQPNKVQYSGWKINWNTGDFTEYPQANSIEYAQKLGVHEVDALQGGALLVRSDVVKEIGFMDEDFFMYYEETDWCLRTKKAGYKLVIVSGAKVWHKGYHSTGGKDSPFQLYFQVRSRFLLMKKHNTFKDWIIFAPIFLATFVLNKTVVFLFTYLKTGNKVNLKKVAAIFKGLLDFYTHNYGPGPKWVQIH